ncbi:MAG TPA: hypothetical protein VF770_03560, partial [Solirubrobacterales bacterium]
MKVACGSITWGRDYPREQVLSEIARAGYEGTPVGPAGATARETLDLYGRFGLKPAPGYIGLDWWKPEARAQQLENAARQAAFSRELGLTEIYVAPSLTAERRKLAGQVTAATATSTDDLKRLADLISAVGRVTLKEG